MLPENTNEAVLRQMAMEYLATVEGDRRYRTFPGDSDVLRDQILALLGQAADDTFDLLAWARAISGELRLGDEPEGDFQIDEPTLLRVGDHVGVLLTHTVREDLSLYAVVQTAPRGYVVVPDAETRPASEAEAHETVRERLGELVHYAELLHVDEGRCASCGMWRSPTTSRCGRC